MNQTDKEREAQRQEDRQVVNIKLIANGFTVRVESETWAFPDLETTLAFVRNKLTKVRK